MKLVNNRLFVGRDDAIRQCGRLFDGIAQKRGGAIFVTGQAGIGKTRLLEAAAAEAARRKIRIGYAANFEYTRAPFGPLIDALRELLGDATDVLPRAPLDREAVAALLGLADTQAPRLDHRRLFVILAETLTRLARSAPWVMIADDMQWADPETLEFFRFLIPRLHDVAGAVILTARKTEDAVADSSLSFGRLRELEMIELQPLDEAAARSLVASLHGGRERLAQRVVDAITQQAEGNPLFLEELTREAATSPGTIVSPTVRQSTHAKMRRLDSNVRVALEAASVIGRRFDLDMLSSVVDAPFDSLVSAMRAGRDAAIIEEISSAPPTFIFRHELVRSSIYEDLLSVQRVALHRAVARSLESRSITSNEQVALHRLASGDRIVGAAAAEAAGDDAVALQAFASARDRYLDAELAQILDGIGLARLQAKLGNAFDKLGDPVNAATRLQSAASYYESIDATDEAAALFLQFAQVADQAGRTDEAIGACRRVIGMACTPQREFSARALCSMFLAFSDDAGAAAEQAAAAESVIGPRVASDEIALANARLTLVRYREGDDWLVPARAAIDHARRIADAGALANALINFGMVATERGLTDEGIDALTAAVEAANANGRVLASAYARCGLIHVLGLAGRLAEAYKEITAVVALHVDAFVVRMYLTEVATPVLLDMGRWDEVWSVTNESLVQDARSSGDPLQFARAVASLLSASAAKGGSLDTHLVTEALTGINSTAYLDAALLAFSRCVSPGQLDRVAELVDAVRELPGHVRVYRRAAQATIATRRRQSDAKTRWSAALEVAQEFGAPLIEAAALESLGRNDEARTIYDRCGAFGRLSRLESKFVAAMTARESEIAALVIRGQSNRAIATALTISERTVEHHVAAILRKFDVSDRSLLAARMTD